MHEGCVKDGRGLTHVVYFGRMAVSADALDDDWWMDPEDKAKEEERMGRKRSRDDNGVKRSKRKNAITQVLLKSEVRYI